MDFRTSMLSTWRVAGVLQRIALAYLAAALITLTSKTRGIALWIAGLLAGYWIAMRFVPVPGFGMPGTDMPLLDPNANLNWYLDRQFLPGAMYEGTRDPEGILSTFPAIATALLGVLTGDWLAYPSGLQSRKCSACLPSVRHASWQDSSGGFGSRSTRSFGPVHSCCSRRDAR